MKQDLQYDQEWLSAHHIASCEIKVLWGWRVERAIPWLVLAFGVVVVVASFYYSLKADPGW